MIEHELQNKLNEIEKRIKAVEDGLGKLEDILLSARMPNSITSGPASRITDIEKRLYNIEAKLKSQQV